jgi:hypothetical protein|tara:strand:+ start:2788 stop:3150 length:363 start_codon:yes stop_codon:yes gene_type:complete
MAANIGYHPDRSVVSEESLADFIRSDITGNLLEVPGIGAVAQRRLRTEHGITTTYQLIAKYLSFKDDTTANIEHADRFYHWICTTGVHNMRRAGVVRCIASKTNATFPNIYSDNGYEENR